MSQSLLSTVEIEGAYRVMADFIDSMKVMMLEWSENAIKLCNKSNYKM